MSRLRVRQSSRGFYYYWTSFLRDWRSVIPEEVWIGPFGSVDEAMDSARMVRSVTRPAPALTA